MKTIVLLALFALSTFSFADEVVLTPTKDAYICTCLPTTTNPGEGASFLHQGDYTTCITSSLIAWDLSSIPTGATITDATLRLYPKSFYGTASGNLTFFPITEDWNETTITPNTEPDYDSANKITAAYPAVGTWLEVDVTSFVEGWYGGSTSNYGVYCSCENASVASVVAYYSSNYSVATYRPQLVVDYSGTGVDNSSVGVIKSTYK